MDSFHSTGTVQSMGSKNMTPDSSPTKAGRGVKIEVIEGGKKTSLHDIGNADAQEIEFNANKKKRVSSFHKSRNKDILVVTFK